MATGFQRGAFQDTAYQTDPTTITLTISAISSEIFSLLDAVALAKAKAAASAVTTATTPAVQGNNIPAPPRLSGIPQQDVLVLQQWIQTLYRALVLEANIVGTQSQATSDLTALAKKVTDLEAQVIALQPPA